MCTDYLFYNDMHMHVLVVYVLNLHGMLLHFMQIIILIRWCGDISIINFPKCTYEPVPNGINNCQIIQVGIVRLTTTPIQSDRILYFPLYEHTIGGKFFLWPHNWSNITLVLYRPAHPNFHGLFLDPCRNWYVSTWFSKKNKKIDPLFNLATFTRK